MAVVIENKMAFLHIPKTAGMWVRRLLTGNGIDHYVWAPHQVNGFPAVLIGKSEKHHAAALPDSISREDAFCILRDPAEWYLSFWLFRNYSEKWKWRNDRTLDAMISDEGKKVFGMFIYEMSEQFPKGFLNKLYGEYIDQCGRVFTFNTMKDGMRELFGKSIKIPQPVNVRRREKELTEIARKSIQSWESEACGMVASYE